MYQQDHAPRQNPVIDITHQYNPQLSRLLWDVQQVLNGGHASAKGHKRPLEIKKDSLYSALQKKILSQFLSHYLLDVRLVKFVTVILTLGINMTSGQVDTLRKFYDRFHQALTMIAERYEPRDDHSGQVLAILDGLLYQGFFAAQQEMNWGQIRKILKDEHGQHFEYRIENINGNYRVHFQAPANIHQRLLDAEAAIRRLSDDLKTRDLDLREEKARNDTLKNELAEKNEEIAQLKERLRQAAAESSQGSHYSFYQAATPSAPPPPAPAGTGTNPQF